MNYTINYHLPQWEESDRVLMTDFNQMCRDMEAGLGRAENARVQALAEQWERVLDRITPLGCDLYHALLRSEPEADYASHWGRIRYFPFASNQEVYDRTGLNLRADGTLALGADTSWSGQLKVTYTGTGFGMVNANQSVGTVGACTFTSLGCGWLRKTEVLVNFNFDQTSVDRAEAQLKVVCKRKQGDQYKVCYESAPFSILMLKSSSASYCKSAVPLELPLAGGGEYQLEVHWLSGSGPKCDYGIGTTSTVTRYLIYSAETEAPTQGTLNLTVQPPAQSQRATALVRYYGGEGVTVTLGGQAMEPVESYSCLLPSGQTGTEAEFRLPIQPNSGPLTATLTATCPTGSMRLHDIGFVFI